MYCPRCGQQQASDALRFCSRCGFPLEGVAGLLAGGGAVAAEGFGEMDGPLTPRQRGTRKGLLIMAGGILCAVFAHFLRLYKEDMFVLMLPALLVIVVGFMRGLYGLMLEADKHHSKKLKSAAPVSDNTTNELVASPPQTLPPARPFPSVTESTTRLLEEEEPARRKRP